MNSDHGTIDEAGLPSDDFLRRISHRFAREHLVLSCGLCQDGTELLQVCSTTPPWIPHNIGSELERQIAIEEVQAEPLAERIDVAYTDAAGPMESTSTSASVSTIHDADHDLLTLAHKGDAARFVDAGLFSALTRGASDIHLQPTATETLVRVRVDGVLVTTQSIPGEFASGVTSRIKVLADLDIAESRLPQDGRASVTLGDRAAGGRSIDLRISTLPTSHGERVVIRLLDNERDEGLQSFDALGMPEDLRASLIDLASRSHGMTLVTGPTGSGKSTTLYATLRWIASTRPHQNIMTIEDPIECDLSDAAVGVSQSQVSTKKGVTFASGLRHILRQDPDVIMIGEIRDEETARIAVQSSLTGHLVFSTLHTNDAPSAITRLIDLGIEPYLIGASLSAVLAQRLVRLTHAACGGEGCQACHGTGYRGRTGIYELLMMSDTIRTQTMHAEDQLRLRYAAKDEGMVSLRDHGLLLVDEGRTTRAEVDRVVLSL
ncbi:MAG: GspE/PulE family protein [Planctomycetota bacterium]